MTDLNEYYSSTDQSSLELSGQVCDIIPQASSTASCTLIDQQQLHFDRAITSIALAIDPDDEDDDEEDDDLVDLDIDDDDDEDDEDDDGFYLDDDEEDDDTYDDDDEEDEEEEEDSFDISIDDF